MTCYHPLPAFRTPTGVVFNSLSRHDIIGSIGIPCGQCLGCRLRRARDWSFRITHEASLYDDNCFVTLTYGRDKLPPDSSLCYRDFQLFMKRLRKSFRAPIRFFMCGEYGPLNLRPHYHACLFNINFSDRVPAGKSAAGVVFFDSPRLREIWSHGHVSVQDLNTEAAAYCARYIVDKVNGDAAEAHYTSVDEDGVIRRRVPEFSRCSLKPGIGSRWFARYYSDVFPGDRMVFDGQEFAVPKYYDRLMRRRDPSDVVLDRIEFARQQRAIAGHADNTDERLAVREVVHKARVSNQKRVDQ